MRRLYLSFLTLFLTLYATGQDLASAPGGLLARMWRPSHSSVLFGAGSTNQLDSYLSPIEYNGPQFSVMVESTRALSRWQTESTGWSFQSLLDINLHTSQTKAAGARYLGGDINYDAAFHHNWYGVLTPRLTLFAGPQAGISLGGLYSTRAGNNPANAHLNLHLSVSVGACYAFYIKRFPISVNYQADLPLIGAAFSPNYGQSYYEMWQKGGYDHNIVGTHIGNAFSLRQMLTASFHIGSRTSLTIGYLGDIRQATLNGLKQHQYGHGGLIGWTRKF